MGLGVPLACGSQCQPPAAYRPLGADLPDQALNLGFTLKPLTAFMAQLSEYLVVQHGVPSSLCLAVVRVGLGKWARLRCSRNEPPFFVDLRMPRPNALRRACETTTSLSLPTS
jgi:hypothetical protein